MLQPERCVCLLFLFPSGAIEEEFEQFCRGVCAGGPFWDHILGYWKASFDCPKRVLFMKYEDMKRDSSFYVRLPSLSQRRKTGLLLL